MSLTVLDIQLSHSKASMSFKHQGASLILQCGTIGCSGRVPIRVRADKYIHILIAVSKGDKACLLQFSIFK
jgi:hypothetical protein